VVARVLLIDIIILQPSFPVAECSDADQGQRGWHFCMCLHMRVHVSSTSLLLPTQADCFHVKWAVINCVISLHQLYPDKSPKSNTKKKGLALGLCQSCFGPQKQLVTLWNLVSWHLGSSKSLLRRIDLSKYLYVHCQHLTWERL